MALACGGIAVLDGIVVSGRSHVVLTCARTDVVCTRMSVIGSDPVVSSDTQH